MTQAEATATVKVLSSLLANIAELEACIASPAADDIILAWDNDLGVSFKGGKTHACGIIHACPIVVSRSRPPVMNCKGEVARPVLRREAAEKALAATTKLLDGMTVSFAE